MDCDRLDAFTKYVKKHRSREDHNLLLNWLMYWRKHLREEEAEGVDILDKKVNGASLYRDKTKGTESS